MEKTDNSKEGKVRWNLFTIDGLTLWATTKTDHQGAPLSQSEHSFTFNICSGYLGLTSTLCISELFAIVDAD